ncbi:hypothetical protein D3C72_1446820 [compost metagenome]
MSIVSTMSAWCSASRAAFEMASEGVDSAEGSRWCGRLVPTGCGGTGSMRVTSLATHCVRPMKPTLITMLNARWNSTTPCVWFGSWGCT